MECLVKRDDNTVAYIHKMHGYNPKKTDTPRPKPKKVKEKNEELYKNISNADFLKILELLDSM